MQQCNRWQCLGGAHALFVLVHVLSPWKVPRVITPPAPQMRLCIPPYSDDTCVHVLNHAVQYVLGKGGVALMLIIIFMAVTSAGSSEFMAVGSLFTFDIYKVRECPWHSIAASAMQDSIVLT